MFDTISIGSATLDIFLRSSQFGLIDNYQGSMSGLCIPYGSKIDVEEFALQSGGGATNTAVGFARMGLHSAVIAEMGRDLPSQLILQELKSENVDISLMVQEENEQTAISALLIGEDGDRSAVTARGASRLLTMEDIPFGKLMAHWIHISSLGNMELVKALAQHGKKQRIRFSWNPGGAELEAMEQGKLHPTEMYPTVLFVNAEEAERLVKAGYELETAGSVVVVTDGAKGGRYFEGGSWHEFAAHPAKFVQATGAGDAFASGFVAAYLHDRRTSEAIEWGKRNAASVVASMGAKTGLRGDLGK